MENDKNKIIIDDDESMNFLSNINNKNNNKRLNKIKIIFKILFYLFIVGVASYSYTIKRRYYNKNIDDNCVIKSKNFNISIPYNNMKHAILVLSSYGVDYLNNFLKQFNNDNRFDIYIHIDGKAKIDIDNNKTIIKSNIKFYGHYFECKRFSMEMGDAMYKLLSIANSNYEYDYYHFMSETCYFADPLDDFYNFFVINSPNSYVNFLLSDEFLFNNKPYILYKGSQWMSIHKNIANQLSNSTNLYFKYKEDIKKGMISLGKKAFDEFIFQNLIIIDICKRKPQNCKVYNNNLRFIRWHSRTNKSSPNFLNIDNISEEEIKYIKLHSFIIRKINYKDPKAMELINKLKNL